MKVQEILTDAIYISLQDRKFQKIVDGGYLLAALNHFNDILDEWKDLIPYASTRTFTSYDQLTNTSFAEVDNVSFVINKSTSTLNKSTLRDFREIQDVVGLTGYPTNYYFDQENQSLIVYPTPSQPSYQFIVDGRIGYSELGMYDDVPTNLKRFMLTSFRYEIAFRLAGDYGVEWDGKKEDKRQALITSLKNKKNIDFSTQNDCVFGLPNVTNSAPFPTWYYISGGTNG